MSLWKSYFNNQVQTFIPQSSCFSNVCERQSLLHNTLRESHSQWFRNCIWLHARWRFADVVRFERESLLWVLTKKNSRKGQYRSRSYSSLLLFTHGVSMRIHFGRNKLSSIQCLVNFLYLTVYMKYPKMKLKEDVISHYSNVVEFDR